jgi:hypothetical protein
LNIYSIDFMTERGAAKGLVYQTPLDKLLLEGLSSGADHSAESS